MATKPAMIDRRHEALGGQRKDRTLSQITTIVWHYTATNNSHITNHERFWRDTYGWDRGGYHFYIDRNGVIYQNYDLERITWGVANSNDFTVHISLEAKTADDYTPAQVRSREALTRWLMDVLNRPASSVKGHYEVYNNTACPGYTRLEMDNFRAQLAKPVAIVAGSAVHKVQAGDTLWALAKKYNMTVDQLKELNGLDSNLIVIGQELKVKGDAPKPQKTALKPLDVVAQEVIDGKWKNFPQRQQLLEKAGYNYHDVQATVDRLLNKKNLLSLEAIAREVIEGKWGNGDERKRKLTDAGYDAVEVQTQVNAMANANKQKKEYVTLPANNATWRAYRLGVPPVAGNEEGFLAPAKYGGLTYEVLGYEDAGQCAVIQTSAFGKVKVYIGKDTNARISKV